MIALVAGVIVISAFASDVKRAVAEMRGAVHEPSERRHLDVRYFCLKKMRMKNEKSICFCRFFFLQEPDGIAQCE